MNKYYKFFTIISISALLVFTACEDRTDLTEPGAPSTGSADFTTFVAVGNSLTAGYQSGSLYESAQIYSFGNMIAQQVGTTYEQPLYSDPGTGGRLEIQSLVPFALKTNTNTGSPLNSTYAKSYNNLAVPGALLGDALATTTGSSTVSGIANPLFDLVLRGQGTMVAQASGLSPTMMLAWLGNNDILGHATRGGTVAHTPTATFDALYSQLGAALAATGSKVVVANIPSVTAIPYFTTVGPGVGLAIQAAQSANPAVLGLFYQKNGEIVATGLAQPTDLFTGNVLITLSASSYSSALGTPTGLYYRNVAKALGIPVSMVLASMPGIDTTQAFGLHPQNPVPDIFVLDPAEISNIASVISAYNSSISSVATANGFGLFDANAFFQTVATSGIVADGKKFTTEFVFGGLFSLDGVHPTSQGYAIIANKFIDVINSKWNADIPNVELGSIPGSLILAKKVTFDKYGIPKIPAGALDNLQF